MQSVLARAFLRTARTITAMGRIPVASRKVGRVLALLALFLACLPEPKTGTWKLAPQR